MGTGFARASLVNRINTAFAADKLADTAGKVAPLGPDADAFALIHESAEFRLAPGMTLEQYRDSLPIPDLNKSILTAAFQYSVAQHIPLSIAIESGKEEMISVTTSATAIAVVLTRVDD
jgi:hypothetical protein